VGRASRRRPHSEITPNYFALARSGVVFADHHAVYPTFTMMNSASIATGTYPGVHGFYGNVVYAPSRREGTRREPISIFPRRRSSRISAWSKPVRDSYQGKLTLVSTMLQTAQGKGLTTGGRSASSEPPSSRITRAAGSSSMKMRRCRSLSPRKLQQAGYSLPRNSANAYEGGCVDARGLITVIRPLQYLFSDLGWTDRQSGRP
jgi:hypothetical protein